MIAALSAADREAKTQQQIELVEVQLAKEFPQPPAGVVHSEVARVSRRLLAQAHFSKNVAVLTGRFAAEQLKAIAANSPQGSVA